MARLGRTSFRGLSGYCDLQIIPPCCQSPSKDRISWVRAIKLNLRALLFNYDIGREKTGDAIKVNDHRPNLRHFSSRVLTFNLKMMLGFHLMLHAAQLWHTETDSCWHLSATRRSRRRAQLPNFSQALLQACWSTVRI